MGKLLELFIEFLRIGSLSFGGGYATMPLIQQYIVEQKSWLTMQEYLDIITISQMTPGPLAVNSSTFVGNRIAGVPGAIIATVGCVLVGTTLSLIMHHFYMKLKGNVLIEGAISGLRSASIGFIMTAALTMISLAFFVNGEVVLALHAVNFVAVLIFAGCLVAIRKTNINPILLLVLCGVVGAVVY